jgi:hypothetical protein
VRAVKDCGISVQSKGGSVPKPMLQKADINKKEKFKTHDFDNQLITKLFKLKYIDNYRSRSCSAYLMTIKNNV